MATEKRLIDANAFLRLLKLVVYDFFEVCHTNGLLTNKARVGYSIETIEEALNQIKTVDAVEVVHGEWATIEDDYCGLTALQCSECNQEYWFEDEPPTKIYNYCPNCGAKMDGGADSA